MTHITSEKCADPKDKREREREREGRRNLKLPAFAEKQVRPPKIIPTTSKQQQKTKGINKKGKKEESF